MHPNPSLSSFPSARGAGRGSAIPSRLFGAAFATILLSISEPAAAQDVSPIRTTIRTVQDACCGCVDDPFGVLGAQASLSSEFDIVPWVDNTMDDTDVCGVFLDRPFDLMLGFEEEYNLDKMAFSLLPNGLEAVYPEGQAAPNVIITIGESSIAYQAMGFRILVPSEHSLPTRQYAAELQILHAKAEGELDVAPSFLVFGIWIDTETATEDQAIVGKLLEAWQRAVDLRDELCNPSTDGLEDPGAAPTVVGRGDEQNFGNNPIRNLEESSALALYDFMSASTSFYTFETEAACGSDNAILWNIADTPVKLSGQDLAMVTTLLVSYMDPSCEMVPVTPLAVESTVVDPMSPSVTKVCLVESSAEVSEEEGVSSEVSEGVTEASGSWVAGTSFAILLPLAILML